MTQFASLFSLATDIDVPLEIPAIECFPSTERQWGGLSLSDSKNGECLPIPSRHYISKRWVGRLNGQSLRTQSGNYLENTYNFHRHRRDLLSIFRCPSYSIEDYHFYSGALDKLEPTSVNEIHRDDLVISIRIGDFVYKPDADEKWEKCVYSRFLGFPYFHLILGQVNFRRLFITSDEPFHPLTKSFDVFDPIRVGNDSALKTMAFVGRFMKIAISESTFSWWASYLTEADEIYFPISTNGLWGINEIWNRPTSSWSPLNDYNVRDSDLYLRVNDDRYKYVHQTSGTIYRYCDAPGKRSEDEFELLISNGTISPFSL